MPENATHIIIHHYIDGTSNYFYFIMVCCMILIVVVVLVVCIILGIVIYLAVSSKKSQQLAMDRSLKRITNRQEKRVAQNLIEDLSSYNGVGTSNSSAQEIDAGTDSNIQSIPLNTFRRHSVTNDVAGDSSVSSAGLYDVLFPGKHEGDIIREPPQRLVTFAGQVYASGASSSGTNLINRPSTSGLTCDGASGSLEWDYFLQRNPIASVHSEVESETEVKQIEPVCWV